MATAVNPSARPKTTIHMGASKFTIHMRSPHGEALVDLRALPDAVPPGTHIARNFELSQAAAVICEAHGITARARPPRKTSKPKRPGRRERTAPATASPMSM